MVAWHNLAPGSECDHDEWHSREHLFERVAIPGFFRGRRCRALNAKEEYFLMYEVDTLATLTSSARLGSLSSRPRYVLSCQSSLCKQPRTDVHCRRGGSRASDSVVLHLECSMDRSACR